MVRPTSTQGLHRKEADSHDPRKSPFVRHPRRLTKSCSFSSSFALGAEQRTLQQTQGWVSMTQKLSRGAACACQAMRAMILIPPGSGGWEMQCLFLHGMMGAGSEVWAGCGGCRARAVLGARGTGRSATLSSLGKGKAREGKKGSAFISWLVVRSRYPACAVLSILQFALPNSHQDLQVRQPGGRLAGHVPLFMDGRISRGGEKRTGVSSGGRPAPAVLANADWPGRGSGA